jgi:hypothetical protein
MQVNNFGKFIPDLVVETLKKSIYRIDTPRNYWVGINDEPRNNLELYTLKSVRVLFPDIPWDKVHGLEWWYHIGKTIRGVNPHFDCDEQRKMRDKVITTPMGCSINYLTDSLEAPTVITNVEPDWYPGDRFYRPTEVTYSFPGKGKTITFRPKYLHGIKTAELKSDRITLMCNVWHYRPDETVRVSLVEDLANFELFPVEPTPPALYSGATQPFPFPYFGGSSTLPYPSSHSLFDTLTVPVSQVG